MTCNEASPAHRAVEKVAAAVTEVEQTFHRPGSGGLLACRDHHAAGGVLEHVVDRLAEDVAVAAARGAEHDDLRLPTLGLLHDRAAGASGADDAVDHAD